ncbi:hypothetical protein CEUSTIGMA_g8126.t1 [Chlamydomonas eustigma]|uniref:Cation efflux protein transmembrane domain-containing protein n=1 Tax=Chlamydomonas eustigma TaxID=1157962 RepID=A0A250XC91_9CHLO|nr:hypothetical protein CEUSTIGMA_g8126.t1 [Chlamydomonas eustigma]|eukprot:GAX80691.1 hypothetical protein CEUSTIGMA_g8126.t1 [Chlamydomonas eustigma]
MSTHDHRAPLLQENSRESGPHKTSGCSLPGSSEPCFLAGGNKIDKSQRTVQCKLLAACILCFIFMLIEVAGGYIAGSVAIMADAAHMLSDVAGLGVSLFAAWAVTKKSHISYSFGYHRAEILGALLSILVIWAVTGALLVEAVQRILEPQEVDGKIMFIIAVAGIVFNLVVGSVLGHGGHGHAGHDHGHSHGPKRERKSPGASHNHGDVEHGHEGHDHAGHVLEVHAHAGHAHGEGDQHDSHEHAGHIHNAEGDNDPHEHEQEHGEGEGHDDHEEEGNINLRSAMLHVLGDLVQSAGVAIAGLLIWYKQDDTRWHIADPICTFVFAIIVLFTTVSIVRDIINTLMERAPKNLDMQALLLALKEIHGVSDVHDLHVWNLSSGTEPIMTAHVITLDI